MSFLTLSTRRSLSPRPHEFAQATDNLSRAQSPIAGLVQRVAK
jgi:hypothetical protein